MKRSIILAFAALPALCACASFGGNDVLRRDELAATAQSGFAPIAYEPPAPGFCADVAAGDRARASALGFDSVTTERMMLSSLNQCTMLVGNFPESHYERLAAR